MEGDKRISEWEEQKSYWMELQEQKGGTKDDPFVLENTVKWMQDTAWRSMTKFLTKQMTKLMQTFE